MSTDGEDRGIKVFPVTDLITFIGFGGQFFSSNPTHKIVISAVCCIYLIVRLSIEDKTIKKIFFAVLAMAFAANVGYVLYDQSSLAKIKVSVDDREYYTDDELLSSDLSVIAIKKNGKEDTIDTFAFSPSTLQRGKNVINVTYKGCNDTVVINAVDPYIVSLRITPVKSTYFVEDKLTKQDFNVEGIDTKGNKQILNNYAFSPNELYVAGNNSIKFVYEQASETLIINAKKHEIVKIEATYEGGKLWQGDAIKKEDFKVIGIYDNGVTEELFDFEVPEIEVEEGDNVIEVKASGLSTKVTVPAFVFNLGAATGEIIGGNFSHNWSFDEWDYASDFDTAGKRHKSGKKITLSDLFHGIDPNGAGTENIKFKLFVPLDPYKMKRDPYFVGKFILDRSMKDKKSYGTIQIIVDGKTVFSTEEMNGSTSKEYPFNVDLSGVDSFEIFVDCTVVNTTGFTFAMVDE